MSEVAKEAAAKEAKEAVAEKRTEPKAPKERRNVDAEKQLMAETLIRLAVAGVSLTEALTRLALAKARSTNAIATNQERQNKPHVEEKHNDAPKFKRIKL